MIEFSLRFVATIGYLYLRTMQNQISGCKVGNSTQFLNAFRLVEFRDGFCTRVYELLDSPESWIYLGRVLDFHHGGIHNIAIVPRGDGAYVRADGEVVYSHHSIRRCTFSQNMAVREQPPLAPAYKK